MTGFRVSEHRTWRTTEADDEAPRQDAPRSPVAKPKTPRPPTLQERILHSPARIHNKIFGRLEKRRPLFLTTRFALILIAVLLIIQGVSGTAQSTLEVGEYERVTEPHPLQAYLAPGSTHKFPIEVAVGDRSGVTAFFTQDRAVVRLPSMGDGGSAYGLHITVQHDQRIMDVSLMIAKPGESFRTIPPTNADRQGTQFEAVRFDQGGEYGVLVRSTDGVGSARILISIVEAPVENTATGTTNWLPLMAGTALATVLAGPYLPGGQKTAHPETQKLRPPAALALSVTHVSRGHPGMQTGTPETLAAQHRNGWIVRRE
jgi:hypothetical protein